jgi:cytochrome c553
MRRLLTAVSAAAFVIGVVVPMVASASAQYPRGNGDVNSGKNIYTNGKGDVPACASCHGADGMGDDNMGTPRLAGQYAVFTRKQLEDYATDKRQDTTMFVMNANAKGLSAKDRNDVATYLESIYTEDDGRHASDLAALKEAGAVPVGATHKGKSIVEWGQGNRAQPLAACRSCHGYNGRGAPPLYPRIGGQKYVYIVNQLKAFRDGTRKNDPMSQMQIIAQRMSDDDIYNAAAYLTTASDYSDGNFYTPYKPEGKPTK